MRPTETDTYDLTPTLTLPIGGGEAHSLLPRRGKVPCLQFAVQCYYTNRQWPNLISATRILMKPTNEVETSPDPGKGRGSRALALNTILGYLYLPNRKIDLGIFMPHKDREVECSRTVTQLLRPRSHTDVWFTNGAFRLGFSVQM